MHREDNEDPGRTAPAAAATLTGCFDALLAEIAAGERFGRPDPALQEALEAHRAELAALERPVSDDCDTKAATARSERAPAADAQAPAQPPPERGTAPMPGARGAGHDDDRLRQSVLDALPAQIAVLDADGRIIAVNAAWRRFADENGGDSAVREGVGLNYLRVCRDVIGEETEEAQRVADSITAVIERRRAQFVHEYPCHGAGQQRWMALTAAPLQGEIRGAVAAHVDITERKTSERDTRRMRESVTQAARLNAVGIVAVSLIHELTQPLSAAAFFSGTAVSLLEQGQASPAKLTQILSNVDSQISRASATVQRLREFLRQHEMRLERVAIDDVVVHAMELLQYFASDRHVRVAYARKVPGVYVVADAMQLQQVLINLVCNGIQAIDAADMPRRKVSIQVERIVRGADEVVSCRAEGASPPPPIAGLAEGDDEQLAQVTVRDTGPGLPDTDAEALFNIFTSSKGSGLGLGLAISRDIIEAHGGRVWAEAAPREGACFHFTIPVAQDGED